MEINLNPDISFVKIGIFINNEINKSDKKLLKTASTNKKDYFYQKGVSDGLRISREILTKFLKS